MERIRTQYGVKHLDHLGLGKLHIDMLKQKAATSSCEMLSFVRALTEVVPFDRTISASQQPNKAIDQLNAAPLCSSLEQFIFWEQLYAGKHGSIVEFVIDNEKELDFRALVLTKSRLLKLPKKSSFLSLRAAAEVRLRHACILRRERER